MRRRPFVHASVLAALLIGCSSSEEQQPASCPTGPAVGKTLENTYGTVSFKPDVAFPEDLDGYQGIEAVGHDDGTETVTLRYAGAAPTFPAGKVIVGYLQAPFYFRRVLASRPVSGGVELDVELAALTDAVAKADVSAYLPVGDDPEALGSGPPVVEGAMYTRGADQGTWTPFELANQTLYEKKKSDGTTAVLLKTSENSALILDGGYDVRVNVDWDEVYFYAKFHGGYYLNLGLVGELDFEGSDTFTKKLYPTGNEDWKTLARFSVCGIPLQLDFRLDGTASVAVDATGSFSAAYSTRRSYGFWFSMRNGTWDSDTIHTLESEWEQPPTWTLDGTATLEAGVKPILALGLGGSYAGVGLQAHAGFTANPRLKLGAEYSTHSNAASTIDWDLDGCLDLGVHASAQASFWGMKKKKEWEKSLWTGCFDIDEGSKCIPNCNGKDCGSDGCNGICGSHYGQCEAGLTCQEGVCTCIPDCGGKICGGDGCGGECPDGCEAYGSIYQCVEGTQQNVCACIPDCTGKECGSDGCGAQCPNTCVTGERCNASNQCEPIPDDCVPECGSRQCGFDPLCGLPCPLGNPGACSATGDECSSHGLCCGLVEEFDGPVGVAYSGKLSSVGTPPGGSSAERVTSGPSELPSAPSVLRLTAGGDGSITYRASFDSVSTDLQGLPFRRAETMVWVGPPTALNANGDVGAAFGFPDGVEITVGIELDSVDKVARVRQNSTKTDLGAIETERWYKLIARANEDFSQIYFEVAGVGGTWVAAGNGLQTSACAMITTVNPPFLRCPLAIETYGSVRPYGMSSWLSVPQTAYFDDVFACR
jgi:hypothetical protein